MSHSTLSSKLGIVSQGEVSTMSEMVSQGDVECLRELLDVITRYDRLNRFQIDVQISPPSATDESVRGVTIRLDAASLEIAKKQSLSMGYEYSNNGDSGSQEGGDKGNTQCGHSSFARDFHGGAGRKKND